MALRKTRFTQGAALMREDIVTPMHHHDEAQDALLVEVDGVTRPMTGCQADGYVTENYDLPELTEVEHVDGGPRHVKRRHILAGAAAGFGALLTTTTMPRYSFAAPPEGSSGPQELLVCVFMRGGFDGLSAVVPVGDPAYYAARSSIAVKAEQTLGLDATWGLNAHMKAMKPIWDEGQLAIIQGSGSPDVSRSHFVDQVTVERAAPASVRSGWLGRHLQTASSQTGTFRGVSIGTSTVFSLTTNALDTLAVSSIDDFGLDVWGGDRMKSHVQSVLEEMYGGAGGQAQETAASTFDAATTLQQIRADQSTAPEGYPDSTWGKGLAEIARLAKAGVGMEVACIDIGDWDMHAGLGSAADEQAWFSRRARDFAEGLAAFRKDLGEHWSRTTVVTMSEFGRRVAENGSGGLDHGQGNTMFVLGGGVKGGRVLGTVPSLEEANLSLGDVPITLDYRQALSEIVSTKLGNGSSVADVFPGFTPGTPLGIV
ncbi:DUF1501 domain-containing protein [Actinomyces slackii]|uniref:Uncharacterized protein conserved in bacteria n=1 Tax=Actinomyces slackii TaxID=52774 RepID=A0A448KBB2_9ACTO|nr:DUF1501 domain-containing protein [Actinomyces slackii]VEG74200.1 Uncharacterized protein conserved in bacteria [Actinomyces slackii]